jgi:hypothetical protein
VALGDDNDVKDRWEVMNSFKDGDASTFKMDRDNKVWPSDSHKRTSTVRCYHCRFLQTKQSIGSRTHMDISIRVLMLRIS